MGIALWPLADRLADLPRKRLCLHPDERRCASSILAAARHVTPTWGYRSGVHDFGLPIVVFDYQTSRADAGAHMFLHG